MASERDNNTSKEFYELCYRQYESEMRETDQIYQRVSFVLVFLSLLGGIIYNLGRIDILRSTFVRVDIFLYYSSLIVAILLLASSVTYCILFALPRKGKYKTLASMDLWQKWRQNYERYRKEADQSSEGSIDDAMMKEITKKLAEAQANNAPINEKRRQYFQMSVLMASLAVIPVALQSLFYVILKVQGV